MKRYLSVFLTLVLIFNFTFIPFSYADTIDELEDVQIGDGLNIGNASTPTPGNPTGIEGAQNGGGGTLGDVISGIFATIISVPLKIFEMLTTPLQALIFLLPTIDGCIFNTQDFFKLSFFDANPGGGLGASLQSSISAIYNAFRYIVTAAYIVVLVYLAIRMMLSSVGRQKALYKELFKHWLVGLLLLFSFHWVMAFVIWLANTFVEILANASASILVNTPSLTFLDNIILPTIPAKHPITHFVVSRIYGAGSGSGGMNWLVSLLGLVMPFISIILIICLIASSFSVILTYFKRLFTIALLILIFPIVALSYVFDKIGDRKAQTLSHWLKEFTVNVMIQPIHALILTFIAIIFSTGNQGEGGLFAPSIIGAIMSLVALRLIPIGEDFLKKLFQINSSMGPGSHGISGSVARAGMALKGAKAMAGSLTNIGSKAFKAGKIAKQYKDKIHSAQNTAGTMAAVARRNALNSGSSDRAARKLGKEAYKQSLKDNKEYQNYLKELKESTGASSLKAARAQSLGQLAAATFAAGTAITDANQGKFISEAASKAAFASEAVNFTVDGVKGAKNLFWGDASKAEEFKKRADDLSKLSSDEINNLSKDQKKKIATELGIDVSLVTGNNKARLVQAYKDMEIPAKWGADKDKLKTFTSFHTEAQYIADGKMPDGSGRKLDLSLFDSDSQVQTKDGIFANINGKRYKVSNDGNSELKDGEEVKVVPNARFKSKKELMQNANNAEYNALETQQASVAHSIKNKETEVQDLRQKETIAKNTVDDIKDARKKAKSKLDKAQNDIDTAQNDIDTAQTDIYTALDDIETAQEIMLDTYTDYGPPSPKYLKAETDYKAAQKRYDDAQNRHNDAQDRYTAAQDRYTAATNDLNTENTRLDAALDAQKAATDAHSAAKEDLSDLRSDARKINTKMEAIEEKTIKQQLTAEKTAMNLGGDPIFTETAYTAAQNTTKHPSAQYINDETGSYVDLGNGQRYTIRQQSNPGMASVSFSPVEYNNMMSAAQQNYINAFENGNASGMATAEKEIESLQSFRSAANEVLNENIGNDVETSGGFDCGVCPNVDNVLNNFTNKGYSIKLTHRAGNQLECHVYDTNGHPVRHNNMTIDINPSSGFNCDALANVNDSVTIVHKDAPFGKKAWYIVKQS